MCLQPTHITVIQILAEEIDFSGLDEDEMILMNETCSYPPRFHVRVSGSDATAPSNVEVKFSGCRDNIDCNVFLQVALRGLQVHDSKVCLYPPLSSCVFIHRFGASTWKKRIKNKLGFFIRFKKKH